MKQISKILLPVIVCLFLTSPFTIAQSKKEYIGQWKGKLNAGGAVLNIVFNVKAENGSIISTMDSPDQGTYGIEVSETIIEKNKIRFLVPDIRGEYTGTLDESWVIIKGTWQQSGMMFNLNLTKQAEKNLSPDEIEFDEIYQGNLKTGGFELRLVIKIYKKDSGELIAYMDSPDQGAKNIPISKISKNDDKLNFEVSSINGEYEGTFKDDKTVEGTWKQAGRNMELNMKRIDKVEEIKRPQTPVKPYPYNEEEVIIKNDTANVELSGTFTFPKGDGPFPAVVLVTGSGPQDRDETLFEHKPFLVIADHLTRNGIAVLRYDERGVGKSTGSFADATSLNFTEDAIAAVEYLASRKDVAKNKIGIIGHSEGGLVAALAASRCKELDYIVMLAGPGLPGKEILLLQTELISRVSGGKEEDINKEIEINRKIYEIVETNPNNEEALKKINELMDEYYQELPDSIKSKPQYTKENLQQNLKQIVTKWFRFFISYDPRNDLNKITIPVLALIGEKDLQVPPAENLVEIEKALNSAGNTNFKTVELEGLNHLFQHAETGAITEYGKIEETFSEDALKLITDWIHDTVE